MQVNLRIVFSRIDQGQETMFHRSLNTHNKVCQQACVFEKKGSLMKLSLPAATERVLPFKVHVPREAIDDLDRRLQSIRWPDRELVDDSSQGVPLAAAQELIGFWRTEFDWRAFEARINSFPLFRTEIDGVGISFIHLRSERQDALPILLTHGWPGSIVEFLDVAERLAFPEEFGNPADEAFHVVIPALPGFPLSDIPQDLGWNSARIARAWANLMSRLGYEKYVAQGGDWGASVTAALAEQEPKGLVAAHVNLPSVVPQETPSDPSDEEMIALSKLNLYARDQSAYASLMHTRPQTIGYALCDSPVALVTWIFEKLEEWSHQDEKLESPLTKTQMLSNIALYWFTGSGASAARLYWENSNSTIHGAQYFSPSYGQAEKIALPMGASLFPGEFYSPPREWAERVWENIFYWNSTDAGGHFAAFEQPELFANEVQRAFSQFR